MVKLHSYLRYFLRLSAADFRDTYGVSWPVCRALERVQHKRKCLNTLHPALSFLKRINVDLTKLDKHLSLLNQTEPVLEVRQQILIESSVGVSVLSLDRTHFFLKTIVFHLKGRGFMCETADPLSNMCDLTGMTPHIDVIRERLLDCNMDRLSLIKLRQAVLAQLLRSKLSCSPEWAGSLALSQVYTCNFSLAWISRALTSLLESGVTAEQIIENPTLLLHNPGSVVSRTTLKSVLNDADSDIQIDRSKNVSHSDTLYNVFSIAKVDSPYEKQIGGNCTAASNVDSMEKVVSSREEQIGESTAALSNVDSIEEADSSLKLQNGGNSSALVDVYSADKAEFPDDASVKCMDVDQLCRSYGLSTTCPAYKKYRLKLHQLDLSILNLYLFILKKNPELWYYRDTSSFYVIVLDLPKALSRLDYIRQLEKIGDDRHASFFQRGSYHRGALLQYRLDECMSRLQKRLDGRFVERRQISKVLVRTLGDRLGVSSAHVKNQLRLHPQCYLACMDSALNTIAVLEEHGISSRQMADSVNVCLYPPHLVLECLDEVRNSDVPEISNCPPDRLLQMTLLLIERRYSFSGEAASTVTPKEKREYQRSDDDPFMIESNSDVVSKRAFVHLMDRSKVPQEFL